jgi:hypothetical protein
MRWRRKLKSARPEPEPGKRRTPSEKQSVSESRTPGAGCGALDPLALFGLHNALRYEQENMSRREKWRKVLDSELKRWSALSCAQLASELQDLQAYEVEFDDGTYQVEVEILENTGQYLHVMVSVDDGSLPASIVPATHSFIRQKVLPDT